MKQWTIFLILITLAVIVLAGDTDSTTVKCLACKSVIEEGDDLAHRWTKGKPVVIHFSCAHERQMAITRQQLRQYMSKD